MTCNQTTYTNCDLIPIPHCYTEGDELPEWHFDQEDVDLTGYDINLLLEREDGTTVARPATAVDLSEGRFFFRFADTDLLPCQVIATLTAEDTSGFIQTLGRFQVTVRERPTP